MTSVFQADQHRLNTPKRRILEDTNIEPIPGFPVGKIRANFILRRDILSGNTPLSIRTVSLCLILLH
jgi:hypothetical protein